MKPGSVLVDLAVERGGNVAGAVAGQVVEVNGVKIVGPANLAAGIATDPKLSRSSRYPTLKLVCHRLTKTMLNISQVGSIWRLAAQWANEL